MAKTTKSTDVLLGRPSEFSKEEKEKLNHALNDLSKKLGSIRIS